jgi:hypothetical protein
MLRDKYNSNCFHWSPVILKLYSARPKVMVALLKLLCRIRKVPGSSLGSETGYPDWGFPWTSLVPPGEFRDSTLKLGTSFQILSSSLIAVTASIIRSYKVLVTENVVK